MFFGILVCGLHVGMVQAEYWPSFDLAYSAEIATHIVLVDGDGKVLESWRGNVRIGELLPFPKNEKSIAVDYPVEVPREEKVKHVSGHRRVLYLIRSKNGQDWTPANVNDPDLRLATVWIEAGRAFAIYQFMNPGRAAKMHPLLLSEGELKRETAKRSKRQPSEAKVVTTPPKEVKKVLDLSGSWRVFLPAGYEYEITLTPGDDGRYKFSPGNYTFSGDYCLEEGQLVSEKEKDQKGQFFWQVHSPYFITLTKQTAAVGSDYTGAVLFRQRPQPNDKK